MIYTDATELAAAIRGKQCSPVEVVGAYLARIEAVNARINALVWVNERAVDEARAAEAVVMRGDRLGAIHGVPVTVKDCFDTAGVRTARGSRLFADHVPVADATAVARLKQAGAIVIGKTNLPEFALWWETDNRVSGRTVNPWDPERTAGGSSGGEAAALAAGMSALGLGSDVGGSIRNPAHHCGVVGFKPTHGRVPLTGHWPATLLRAMHVGPLARTVRDVGLGLRILTGPDGLDPYAVPVTPPEMPDPGQPLPPLRVGWTETGGAAPVHADVAAAVRTAAARLAQLGCRVEPVRIPALEDHDWNLLTLTVYGAESGPYLAPLIAGREAELHPFLRTRLSAPPPSLADYVAALATCDELKQHVARYFTGHDLLLGPCVPLPAHRHDQSEHTIEGHVVAARHALRATLPWDITGSPALAVPFAVSREGLPIAVQVVGRHFDETTVLRAGLALEAASAAAGRRPPL